MLNLKHNVVNMLYVMKGLMESHARRREEGLFQSPEEAYVHAQMVLDRSYLQVSSILEIIRRLSRLMMNKQDQTPIRRSFVPRIWRKVERLLKHKYGQDYVNILCHIPEEFPELPCEERDLTEILYCLAENAMQAMSGKRNGEAATAAFCDRPKQEESAHEVLKGKLIIRAQLEYRAGGSRMAELVIADTGPGMAAEVLEKLFEPFVSTKLMEEGFGLGLCLVRNLVSKNHGTISVSSFPGRGTTFSLSFPLFLPHQTVTQV